ncbi:HK97-gp10 family putative phage morphogenesis protein [Streptococcus infantarius]|uniref:HK97-gp10 family putative phage morphogenesis protein n=1 Tax=Streptococcus infantarius TaxID=102684 RepID=UPI0022DF177D|nr:HK97-gp10 family putative phage morphogenesis protein [Streptococcus infantarius]
MAQVEIKGDDILLRALQTAANMKAHKAIVKKYGGELQSAAKDKAVFAGHYEGKKFVKATGATKRSIKLEITDGGFAAKVTAGTDYSGYLEKGTRFMDAQPFMKPAFDVVQPKFINDLRRADIAK